MSVNPHSLSQIKCVENRFITLGPGRRSCYNRLQIQRERGIGR